MILRRFAPLAALAVLSMPLAAPAIAGKVKTEKHAKAPHAKKMKAAKPAKADKKAD